MKLTRKSTILYAALLAAVTSISAVARAQSVAAKPAPASDQTAVQPAPRLADGKVDLGGKGVWAPIWVLDWADKKYVEENIDVPFTPAGRHYRRTIPRDIACLRACRATPGLPTRSKSFNCPIAS